MYQDTGERSPIPVLTGLGVEQPTYILWCSWTWVGEQLPVSGEL